MSCFVVSNNHINALINFARVYANGAKYLRTSENTYNLDDRQDLTKIAQVLLRENERAFCERYKEPADNQQTITFNHNPFKHDRPVEILKACNCYLYQISDAKNYKKSEAFEIVQTIKERAIMALPGYDAAAWEIK